MEENILARAMQLRDESEEKEQQLRFVSEQIASLNEFKENLKELDKNTEREILAPLGRGVFVKSELKEKKLFVDVGAGVVLRKTPLEVGKIIDEQIGKFQEARVQIASLLESYALEFNKMLKEVEKLKK